MIATIEQVREYLLNDVEEQNRTVTFKTEAEANKTASVLNWAVESERFKIKQLTSEMDGVADWAVNRFVIFDVDLVIADAEAKLTAAGPGELDHNANPAPSDSLRNGDC